MRTTWTSALLFIVGCTDPDPLPPPDPGAWALPARLRVAADDPAMLQPWRDELAFNIGEFTFAVQAINPACPTLFVIADDADAHEARLGECDGFEPGLAGRQDRDGGLAVFGVPAANHYRSELRGTIMHVLGHAIGLDHADPFAGPSAMTVPPGTQLFAQDAARAACVLGCGPCN